MDPKQTLIDAADAADAKDWETVTHSLANYRFWRIRGGYEPNIGGLNGDFVESELRNKMASYGPFEEEPERDAESASEGRLAMREAMGEA